MKHKLGLENWHFWDTSPEVGVALRSHQSSARAHSIFLLPRQPGHAQIGAFNVISISGAGASGSSSGYDPPTKRHDFFQSPYRYRLSAAVQSNKVYLARLALLVFTSIAARKINAIR